MKQKYTGKAEFLERIKRPECPPIAVLSEELNIPKTTLYAWSYSDKKMRATRDLLRRRMKFVRIRAKLYAHIKIMGHQINDSYGNISFNNKCRRVGVSDKFSDSLQKTNCDTDLHLMGEYDKVINNIETQVLKEAKRKYSKETNIIKTIPGVGRVLSLVMILEIGDIKRFPTVQKFASYCRLVKCAHESAGKRVSYGNSKIGNAYLKWAFSEAACLLLTESERAKRFKQRAERKHGKSKALTLLSHRIGRSVYYMLKRGVVFDEERCFGF